MQVDLILWPSKEILSCGHLDVSRGLVSVDRRFMLCLSRMILRSSSFCLEVSCWSTAHFVLLLSSSCSNSFALRRCFGWRQAWRLCRRARSHGALKSAASLAQLRLPASYGSIADSPVFALVKTRYHCISSHTCARDLDLTDKEPWWDKGGYSGR